VAGGKRRFGQRQDDPALDDLLDVLHAAELVPEVRIDHAPSHHGQGLWHGHRDWEVRCRYRMVGTS
jgi:hypothetical protein